VPLGTKLCTSLCTAGGRREKSWGLTESSGDNPGDSEIPLDLVFPVRESIPRTGQRTPTGAGKPGRTDEHLRVIRVRSRVRSTRRKRVRTERETTRSGHRVAGQPGATGTGLPGRGRGSTPTAPHVEVRRRHNRWHGLPGQRERRREATEPACRQTGPRLRQRGPVRRATRSGRHSRRETGGNARTQRGRVAGKPGVQLRDDDRFADPRPAVAANIGRPMDGVERQRVRAAGPTAENGHRPPNLWSDGRCDDRAKG
jgi:hypothetical protein